MEGTKRTSPFADVSGVLREFEDPLGLLPDWAGPASADELLALVDMLPARGGASPPQPQLQPLGAQLGPPAAALGAAPPPPPPQQQQQQQQQLLPPAAARLGPPAVFAAAGGGDGVRPARSAPPFSRPQVPAAAAAAQLPRGSASAPARPGLVFVRRPQAAAANSSTPAATPARPAPRLFAPRPQAAAAGSAGEQQAQPHGPRLPARPSAAVAAAPAAPPSQPKVSEAQRAAHKRFRDRRKHMVAAMEADVSNKLHVLSMLEAQHAALQAKSSALDAMLASAGDSAAVWQRLEQLTMEEQEQQEQQQGEDSGEAARPDLAVTAAAAAGAAAAAPGAGAACAEAAPHGGPTASQATALSASAASSSVGSATQDAHDLAAAGRLRGPEALQRSASGTCMSSSRRPGSAHGRSPLPADAAAAHTCSMLEATIAQVLGAGAPGAGTGPRLPPGLGAPATEQERERVAAALPRLRDLLKSLVGELMPLVVQVAEEQRRAAPAAAAAAPAAPSPAAARVQSIVASVAVAFRSFAATNGLTLFQLRSLNLDTGTLGAQPPGHFARAAQVLRERLDAQTLVSLCTACRMHQAEVSKTHLQRQQLLRQLHGAIDGSGSDSDSNSNAGADAAGAGSEAAAPAQHELLDALAANLRREHVLEAQAWFTYTRMIPLTVNAELLVWSWPYLADHTAILAELAPSVLPAQ